MLLTLPSAPVRFFTIKILALALVLLILAVGLSPWSYHYSDFSSCWVKWARVTGGWQAWMPYEKYPERCNYPPFFLWALSLSDAVRQWWGVTWEPQTRPAPGFLILAIKLPIIAGHVALLLVAGLLGRKPLGDRAALLAAAAVLASPALWVNGVIWAQWDVCVAAAMLAALLVLARSRPAIAGACFGIALSMKLQAIMILPVLALYCWRKLGPKCLLYAALAALLAWSVIAVPVMIGGRSTATRGIYNAYVGAMDHRAETTANAFNTWWLKNAADAGFARDLRNEDFPDNRPLAGSLTAKHLGLLATAAWLALVLAALWRRMSPEMLIACAAASVFGFFMLSTQMHERYAAPAVALLAAVIAFRRTWLWLFVGLSLTVAANQALILVKHNFLKYKLIDEANLVATSQLGTALAMAQVLILLWWGVSLAALARPRPREQAEDAT